MRKFWRGGLIFLSDQDVELTEGFLKNGYIIQNAADLEALNNIRQGICELARNKFKISQDVSEDHLLNNLHEFIDGPSLNEFRVTVIQNINSDPSLRRNYYEVAKPYLEALVGNELAMQLRVNLSIQLPGDSSSLLPVHADTWSGDSPFEVVVWVPLVDCFKTKAMYLLPPAPAAELVKNFKAQSGNSSEDLYQSISNQVEFLDVKYGQVLVFNQGLPHGNRLNEESQTRWSMNCRFKGVFTPYGDKKIGEFFEPITLRAASKVGMDYKFPVVI